MALSEGALHWLDAFGFGPLAHVLGTVDDPANYEATLLSAHPELTPDEASELIAAALAARHAAPLLAEGYPPEFTDIPSEGGGVDVTASYRYRIRIVFRDPTSKSKRAYRSLIIDEKQPLDQQELDQLVEDNANAMMEKTSPEYAVLTYIGYKVDSVTLL